MKGGAGKGGVVKGGAVTLLRAFIDAARWRASAPASPGAAPKGGPVALLALNTGGCEGCAMEAEALWGAAFAAERWGFRRAAEPAEAEVLLVSGVMSRACVPLLDRAWSAMPPGRSLVALGSCAVDGGIFGANYATLGGLSALTSVRHVIPGCPPSPEDILRGLSATLRG